MINLVLFLLRPLASLRLTLVLLGLSIILVFWGTLAQASQGLYLATEAFFHSFFIRVQIGERQWPVFPAGYTLGLLLLANLLTIHLTRFQWHWRKLGIHLIHGGLILLLIGELASSVWQEDFMLRLDEGQIKNFAEAFREAELVLIDISDPDTEKVHAVRGRHLAAGRTFSFGSTGLNARLESFLPNAEIRLRREVPEAAPTGATRGVGPQVAAFPQPRTTRLEERDMAAAYVEITDQHGESLGTWFLSAGLVIEQAFHHQGRDYIIGLRQRRTYFPFSLELLNFTHERHPGTDIPRTFSSELALSRPGSPESNGRRIVISMNQPFRDYGYTFYQSGFENEDQTSILQVVRNPSRWIPYVSCSLITFGLLFQFGLTLARSHRRPSPGKVVIHPDPADKPFRLKVLAQWFPRVLPALLLLFLGFHTWRSWTPGNPVSALGEIPVLHEGRLKPLDTVARSTLLLLNARQRVVTENGRLSPMEWIKEVLFQSELAHTRAVFLIHHPDVLDLAGLPHGPKRYTFVELKGSRETISSEAQRVSGIPTHNRTTFEQAVLQLHRQLVVYQRLVHSLALPDNPDFASEIMNLPEVRNQARRVWLAREAGQPESIEPILTFQDKVIRYQTFAEQASFAPVFGLPLSDEEVWKPLGNHLFEVLRTGELPSHLIALAHLISAAQEGSDEDFSEALSSFEEHLANDHSAAVQKVRWEARFNAFAPFYLALILYLGVFLLVLAAWIGPGQPLLNAAYRILAITFVLHTLGLVMRMIIEGRPPVTNLYSSAVFIGWGTILFGLLVERFFRQGFALGTSAFVGFATLIVAHHLSLSGDTMEVMRAVLDSNFWLATHVIIITLGYSATFLAGAMGLGYFLWWILFRRATPQTNRRINGLIYGVLCFALLFSFVGTVLGGIWADQSWGRFWGWDPKENGALLIVLWNAIILHARMAGYVQLRGLAALALLGTIVTAWSWFGTNMLGIGLHSYGFTDQAFVWLSGYAVVSAFLASSILLLPQKCLKIRVEGKNT